MFQLFLVHLLDRLIQAVNQFQTAWRDPGNDDPTISRRPLPAHQTCLLQAVRLGGGVVHEEVHEGSRRFLRRPGDLAVAVDEALPDSAEKTVALHKLLEAKDSAVRAALDLLDEADR